MNRIGIIAAMQPEMELIKESIESCEKVNELGIEFYVGNIGNTDVVLSLCGVGKVNASMATAILISSFECNLIINSGIAGGVAPLNTKDVVVASSLMYHDFDTTLFGYAYGQVPQMPKEFVVNPNALMLVESTLNKLNIEYKTAKIYSGDQFVSSLDALKNVGEPTNCAVEMEGAAIAHVATKAGVDFIVIRFISDIIGADKQVDDYLAFESEMAKKSANITLQLLNNL